MTTIVVAMLRVDEGLDEESIEELALAELLIQELDYDDLWVAVLARRLIADDRSRISEKLCVVSENICVSPRLYGAHEGTVLLGNAIAFLGGHDRLILFDCDSGETTEEYDLTSNSQGSTLYRKLALLEDAHGRKMISDSVRYLDAILDDADGETNFMNHVIRRYVLSVARFMKTFQSILTTLPRNTGKDARIDDFRSLLRVDLALGAARLREMRREFPERMHEMEFAKAIVAFIGFGQRAMRALRVQTIDLGEEIFAVSFGWLSVYFLAAGREAVCCGQINSGLLHLNRSFELYLLAYLARAGFLEWRGNRLVLDDGNDPTSLNLWRRFSDVASKEFIFSVETGIASLRKLRNANILIHGFHVPDESEVAQARSHVKGVMANWEKSLENHARLIRGPIEAFFKGEKWNDNLAMSIALCIIDHVRA